MDEDRPKLDGLIKYVRMDEVPGMAARKVRQLLAEADDPAVDDVQAALLRDNPAVRGAMEKTADLLETFAALPEGPVTHLGIAMAAALELVVKPGMVGPLIANLAEMLNVESVALAMDSSLGEIGSTLTGELAPSKSGLDPRDDSTWRASAEGAAPGNLIPEDLDPSDPFVRAAVAMKDMIQGLMSARFPAPDGMSSSEERLRIGWEMEGGGRLELTVGPGERYEATAADNEGVLRFRVAAESPEVEANPTDWAVEDDHPA